MSDSKAEFRAAFRERLRQDGVLDEITASIRSRILKMLLQEGRSSSPTAPPQHDLLALLWLFHHFLEQRGYTHTLSVFATESRLEHSIPLSCSDAMKIMGLQEIWEEIITTRRVETDDFVSSLPAVVLWVNSLREKHTALEIQSAEKKGSVNVSASVQTETHEQSESNHESSRCNDFTILEIERECQRRLRQEMNQKLRLSAKKQATQATRRLEQKHKEAIQALHHQIEVERNHAKCREDELTKELTQQQILAHQERDIAEQRVHSMVQEMHSHQREMYLLNERVKVMQKQRLNEWTDEHDVLQEKARTSIIELQDDKRKLLGQMHEVAMQKEEVKSKELQFASLTREKSALQTEIQDLRHRQTAALAMQQSSFDRKQSEVQAQLEALRKEYIVAKAELDASKIEVSRLQALLRQSQEAIELVSFLDVGPTSVISPPPVLRNRSLRRSVQLIPRAQSNFVTNFQSTILNPISSATYKTGNGSCLREFKGKDSPPPPPNDASTSQEAIFDSLPPTQVDHTESIKRTLHQTHSSTGKRNQIIDPPCILSKDPPEMNIPKRYEECWGHDHGEKTSEHNKVDDIDGNFRGSRIGNDIVLNLSPITDDLQWQVGSAAQSMTSLVQVAMSAETSLHAVTRFERNEGEPAIAGDNADEANKHHQQTIQGALFNASSMPIDCNDELVAESEKRECNLSTNESTTSPKSAPNKDRLLSSWIAVQGHMLINPPQTVGDRIDDVSEKCDEFESNKHGSLPEPIHPTHDTDKAHASPLASPEPQSEHSQIFDEKINSKVNCQLGGHYNSLGLVQSIYDPDKAHTTETANKAQRSTISLPDSEQYSEHFYTFEGHFTSNVNEPERYKESEADTKSQSEHTRNEEINSSSQSIYHPNPDEAKVTALVSANNPQRSTTSLADSEQYSEHFYTLDDGNYYSSKPAKVASPSPASVCSENYSIEFSFSSEG